MNAFKKIIKNHLLIVFAPAGVIFLKKPNFYFCSFRCFAIGSVHAIRKQTIFESRNFLRKSDKTAG